MNGEVYRPWVPGGKVDSDLHMDRPPATKGNIFVIGKKMRYDTSRSHIMTPKGGSRHMLLTESFREPRSHGIGYNGITAP